MQIGQLARRVGVNPRTIRFYESKGLLAPAARGRYRQYTDKELNLLLFVRRAQTMGLSLAEIRDLLRYRAAGSCAGLRSRLGDLLAAKIAELRKRSAELLAFSRELETIRRRLGRAAGGGTAPAPALCDCLPLTTKATSGKEDEKNGFGGSRRAARSRCPGRAPPPIAVAAACRQIRNEIRIRPGLRI